MKNKLIALLAACAMVTAAGCGTPPAAPDSAPPAESGSQSQPAPAEPPPAPTQEVDRDTIYTVHVDNNVRVSFDADGNVVEDQAEQEDNRVLNDVLTGEPRYRIHTKTTDTGEDDEWGNPLIVKTTALYDMDGKLLYDYGKYTYDEGVGELVVRKDQRGMWASIDDIPANFFSELWNPKTGKTVLPNVATVSVLNKDSGLLAACDIFNVLLGTVDTEGNLIKSAKNAHRTRITGNRMIVSNTPWDNYEATNEQYTLLDENLEVITTAEYISGRLSWTQTGLMEYRDKDVMGMMDSNGKRLFELSREEGQYIDFCDGERVIMNTVNGGAVLMKTDGTQLGEKYEQLMPVCPNQYNVTEPPAQFAARRGKTISILDRQGKVVVSKEIEGLSSFASANGRYIFYTTGAGSGALLDMQLNVLIPPDKYNNLYQPSSYNPDGSSTLKNIIIATYYPRKTKAGEPDYSLYRMDIYDENLNLIADSVSEIGTVSTGRIAVVRGFSAGVIDWQGNWIGKTTIFQTAGDERKVEFY